MTLKLATIENELNERAAEYARVLTRFLSQNDRRFISMCEDADKLGRIDGAARSVALIRIYGLTGDREKVDYYLDNAKRLSADPVSRDLAQISALLCMGYFFEASIAIRKCVAAHRATWNLFLTKPPVNAMFHFVDALHTEAKAMNMMHVPEMRQQFTSAIPIMDEWGDSDEDYAAALDMAGEVMRRRQLMLADQGLRIRPVPEPADGSLPYVKLAYRVDVDLDTAIDMTCEYAELLAGSQVKIPQSLVFEFLPVEEV